jgi:membrane protein required for beta-lactamase induction
MTFLAVLAALIAERYLLHLEELRTAPWFDRYFDWHQSLPIPAAWRSGLTGYLGLILLPVALTAAAEHLLAGRLSGLPEWIFSTLVLLYTLGPTDLDRQAKNLLAALRTGDRVTAQGLAERLRFDADDGTGKDTALLCQGVLIRANRRLFAPICWFVLLGPAGAVLYRFSRQIARLGREHARDSLLPPTARAIEALDWLPVRVTAAGYALAGCAEGAIAGWRGCLSHNGTLPPERLLGCVALGSLGHGHPSDEGDAASELRRSIGLVWRALGLWVILLGLVTLPLWFA